MKEVDPTDDGCPKDPFSTDRSSLKPSEKKGLSPYREEHSKGKELRRQREEEGDSPATGNNPTAATVTLQPSATEIANAATTGRR